MPSTIAAWAPGGLAAAILVSEILIGRQQRLEPDEDGGADRGSHRLIWLVMVPSIVLASIVAKRQPAGAFVLPAGGWIAVGIVFAAGATLRWWAVRSLGRLFTVRVAIREGHRLVTAGPYAWLRHPAYTGVLLQFLAMGLGFQHVLSLCLVLGASVAALAWRIAVEEAALAARFGADWTAFASRRARVLPGLW